MNTNTTQIKRALISVSDKTGLIEFAQSLHELGVEIISTGGTYKKLLEANIPAIEISEFTGFPEMMDGRVKTLHPLVHGGILGLRDNHAEVAQEHNIKWIDLVVVNLYPFSATIQKPNVSEEEVIENIDIGGPSMIRSAAKNIGWVGVVVDTNDYLPILEEIKTGGLTYEMRKKLSAKAFSHTAQYDSIIAGYFNQEKFPEKLSLTYEKFDYELRYGENPHQLAAVYKEPNNHEHNILNAKILQGKKLSYNNLNDADGGLTTLREFTEPACVVVKHANPCGSATGTDITEVFKRAYNADALSAFGGIICLNRVCTKTIAEEITKVFAEIVLAPNYEPEALEILATKKNLRVLELGEITTLKPKHEYKYLDGGLLVQDQDVQNILETDLKIVTKVQPTEAEIQDMLFAWKVLKHVKSNAILIAKNNTTIGIGPGQVSRVEAVEIAIRKSGDKINGAILASDAFFPFRDSIDKIASTGIKAIIQPGGSIKDEEVIQACDEHGIAMVFTGVRCFKH
ncbi:MAG: bifunctional phosphoribosylaminoimidazolecarboxamide formyltransferase/IMP cyclohydrolase [Candidatus Magasanikiibacteriota bacterium]